MSFGEDIARRAVASANAAGLTIMEWVQMRSLDNLLGHHHCVTSREEAADISAAELARRIREDLSEEGPEKRRERTIALMFGHYEGDSLEECGALLDRYMTLLDRGVRP